jgi:hypothetical protein
MIAGAAWYAYPILKRHDSSLAQLVHAQQAMEKIDGSLREQQRKVAEWSNDREQSGDQVTKLGLGKCGRLAWLLSVTILPNHSRSPSYFGPIREPPIVH